MKVTPYAVTPVTATAILIVGTLVLAFIVGAYTLRWFGSPQPQTGCTTYASYLGGGNVTGVYAFQPVVYCNKTVTTLTSTVTTQSISTYPVTTFYVNVTATEVITK